MMLYHEPMTPVVVNLTRGKKRIPHHLMLFESDCVSSQMRNGWFAEGWELSEVRRILTQDSVVLDCGAHIGNHSMFLSPFVSKIHAFEASPISAAALGYNLVANGYRNVEIHNVPIWDKDDVPLEVIYDSSNQGHNSCRISDNGVKSRCLDSFNFDRVDFIKIDTEGAEAKVLAGARKILSKFRPYLMLEVHSWMHSGPARTEYVRQVAEILNEFEYRWGINCMVRGT